MCWGAISGAKGEYLAKKGKPSHTTVWHRRHDEEATISFINTAEAQRGSLNGKSILITHFFESKQQPISSLRDLGSEADLMSDCSQSSDGIEAIGGCQQQTSSNASDNLIIGADTVSEDGDMCNISGSSDSLTAEAEVPPKVHSRPFVPAPTRDITVCALAELELILHPPHKTGHRYKKAKLDLLSRSRLEQMAMLLQVFTEDGGIFRGKWIEALESVVHAWGMGNGYGQQLWGWCCAFSKDMKTLPKNPYGWKTSVLLKDEDLKIKITEYLQAKGKFISAQDVVDCVSQPHLLAHLCQQKPISVQTARRWMAEMGYHWQTEPKGQYADGHECEDVVDQCQKVYLPFMAKCEKRTREWDSEGKEIVHVRMWEGEHYAVIWFHDECIFYAHDH